MRPKINVTERVKKLEILRQSKQGLFLNIRILRYRVGNRDIILEALGVSYGAKTACHHRDRRRLGGLSEYENTGM